MSLRAALAVSSSFALAVLPAATAAAASHVPPPGNAAAPPADLAPVCGSPAASGFPIDSRLRGGPSGYPAGLLSSGFSLDLHNTTGSPCTDVHPLIILVDRDGRLTPRQFSLRYEFPGVPWRTVPIETTDRGENIGIPGGTDGPGLTLPPGATVTVRLRLWFAPDAPAERVVASATTMQRRGDDGMWIAESNHYAFDVVPPPATADPGAQAGGDHAGDEDGQAGDFGYDSGSARLRAARTGRHAAPAAPELAATGAPVRLDAAALRRLAALSGALVGLGAALLACSRRRLAPRRARRTARTVRTAADPRE
jgi:hypothetical protein